MWNWKTGGLALGLVFFLAVLLVKPIGVSTQFVILDGIVWDMVDPSVVTQTEDGKYTSTGHMMSGMMQTSLSGYLFALGAFGAAVPVALMSFVLDRVGAANPQFIIKMLNLTNLHLAKAILLAIGVGSILMFGGQMLGLVDVGNMSVKTAYVGVIVGGALLGIGWAVSGFCPGTGVAAAATGRKDALFFIAGGLLGAAAYMATYPSVKTSLPGDILGIVLGIVFIVVAFALPERLVGTPEGKTQPAE